MPLSSKQETLLLYTLTALQFIIIVDFMIMMPLSALVIKEFNIGTSAFGLIVSVYSLSAAFSALLASSLADRYDRKLALLWSFAGLIVGTISCGIADDYIFLIGARLIAGFFGGVLGAVLLSIIGDLIAPNRRGYAMGIVMLAFSLASVGGVPLGLWISNYFGWQAPFIFLSGIAIVVWLICLKVIPNVKGHLDQPRVSFIQSYKSLLSVKNHWWGFSATMSVMFGSFLVIPYIAPAMVKNSGMLTTELMYMYLVGGAVTLISRPIVSRLTDKYRHANVFVVIAIVSFIPIILVTQAFENSLFMNLFIAALFFIFVSSRFIPITSLVISSCEPKYRGRVMSFNASMQNLASGLAALISGLIMFTNESGQLVRYDWVGYISVVVGLVSIWLVYKIKAMS